MQNGKIMICKIKFAIYQVSIITEKATHYTHNMDVVRRYK